MSKIDDKALVDAIFKAKEEYALWDNADPKLWPLVIHTAITAYLAARQPEASQQPDIGKAISDQPDQESKREKQLGQDIYDEIFDAWLTKLVGDQSVQAHCQRLADKIMKHVGGYLQQPAREAAQPDGQSFDEWCASVKDCGYDVQPNSATARQRKLGWDAAIASMKRETIDYGALAAHVASAIGAMQGYGFQGVAAVKSLEHVQNVLMQLYDQGRRGSGD